MVFFPSELPASSEKGSTEEGKTKTCSHFTRRLDKRAPSPLFSPLMLFADVSNEE